MTRRRQLEKIFGYLLLIALMFTIHGVARKAEAVRYTSAPLLQASCLVGIRGPVRWPGIYGFNGSPTVAALIKRSGGLERNLTLITHGLVQQSLCDRTIVIHPLVKHQAVIKIEPINAYQKITLAMKLDLNSESAQGLTAIPGIGLRTAKAIVAFRQKVGPITSIDQLTAIPGIGPNTVQRISPFVTLRNTSCKKRHDGGDKEKGRIGEGWRG